MLHNKRREGEGALANKDVYNGKLAVFPNS